MIAEPDGAIRLVDAQQPSACTRCFLHERRGPIIERPASGANEEPAKAAVTRIIEKTGAHAHVRRFGPGDEFPRQHGNRPDLVARRTRQAFDAPVVQPPILKAVRPEARTDPRARDAGRQRFDSLEWSIDGRETRLRIGRRSLPAEVECRAERGGERLLLEFASRDAAAARGALHVRPSRVP